MSGNPVTQDLVDQKGSSRTLPHLEAAFQLVVDGDALQCVHLRVLENGWMVRGKVESKVDIMFTAVPRMFLFSYFR